MKHIGVAVLTLSLWAAGASPAAPQGSVGGSENCGDQRPDPNKKPKDPARQAANSIEMAAKVRQLMMDNGASVAIVSRAGGDLSDRRFRDNGRETRHKYTHAGIFYRTTIDGETAWRVIHLINTCAGPSSEIMIQRVPEFFMDDPLTFDTGVTIPSGELQDKIQALIGDESWWRGLHNSRYSNIAYPFSTTYQNSNMWVVAVVAAAKSGLRRLDQVQEFYKRDGFRPSQAKLGFLEGAFGPALKQNVKLDAHPRQERGSGWYSFVSAVSTHEYVKRGALLPWREVCHSAGCGTKVSTLE